MRTKAFIKSRDQRKRVEMRFAHLKTHHGFERMRPRDYSGAYDEFLLAAIVQNLKTLACESSGHRPTRSARHLPNRTDGRLSCVHVEVAEEPEAANPITGRC
jgi:Transposase DDE domain